MQDNEDIELTRAPWYQDYEDPDDDIDIDMYEITSTPNDFNLLTMVNFIDRGSVIIPGFQRNYVWDLARASKLIESLLLGLPVPQVFLYEQEKNRFLVIDGQQRLMSIYYFTKQRFPRKEKRIQLRRIVSEHRTLPADILNDDEYFQDFRLSLPERLPEKKNRFKGRKFETLGEFKESFELRTIRNIIVKQTSPNEDDSSMYELFYRLNTGGVNLKPQEIRSSIYHSDFYQLLERLNLNQQWRLMLKLPEPDLHQKDIEILLRGFAMLMEQESYKPSMKRFLNRFSKKAKLFSSDDNEYFFNLYDSFLKAIADVKPDAWSHQKSRLNIALYEAVFAVSCRRYLDDRLLLDRPILQDKIERIRDNEDFRAATQKAAADRSNVQRRLEIAKEILAF